MRFKMTTQIITSGRETKRVAWIPFKTSLQNIGASACTSFFFHVDQMSDSLIVVQHFVHLQYFLPNVCPLLKLGVNIEVDEFLIAYRKKCVD